MKMKEVKLKEWTRKMKEWNQKMKKWKIMSYLLSENYIAYGILPPSTTRMKDSIRCINLIIGSHALQNVTKANINVVKDIATFVEPTPPTNIITK